MPGPARRPDRAHRPIAVGHALTDAPRPVICTSVGASPRRCAVRWMGGRQSDNVEDRRGMGVPLVAGGGIGTIVLLVLALFFGFDPSVILQGGDGTPPPVTQAPAPSALPRGGDEVRHFVATVRADTEDT